MIRGWIESLHINPTSLSCRTIWQVAAWPPGVALVLQYLQGWRSPPLTMGPPSKSSTRIWCWRSVQSRSAWNYDGLNYSILKSNSWSLLDGLQWNIYFSSPTRTNTMGEMSGTHMNHIGSNDCLCIKADLFHKMHLYAVEAFSRWNQKV